MENGEVLRRVDERLAVGQRLEVHDDKAVGSESAGELNKLLALERIALCEANVVG